MTNKSAALLIIGFCLRNFEIAVTYGFMTDYIKHYFDDPKIPAEQGYKQVYPIICGISSIIGPIFGNWSTYKIIKIIGEDNPMAIPYVCIFRLVITIPSVFLLFLIDKGFWVSISGFVLRQMFSLGQIAPTILML